MPPYKLENNPNFYDALIKIEMYQRNQCIEKKGYP
jgi:hypothetical protein